MHMMRDKRTRRAVAAISSMALAVGVMVAPNTASAHEDDGGYKQTNLVSDVPGRAQITDANLVNAWGLSAGPATPVWVSNNHSDTTTLYKGADGTNPVSVVPLVVSIDGGAPTGTVFNATAGFPAANGKPARFLFASESGNITAWNQTLNPITKAPIAKSVPDAIYKGLAIATTSNGSYLYAANFHAGTVDVFDEAYNLVHWKGAFRDHRIPDGYAPFNVQELGGHLYVSYAKQGPGAVDDEKGPGHGFVDVFSTDGHLLRRLIRRGALNSPWGLAIAPDGFGRFSGALLVGNFGDGRIHAYDPMTGERMGTLRDGHHHAIVIDGLWALRVGNGVAGSTHTVLFTAGPNDEEHGLFGALDAAPEMDG
jgi:uncharacterized protein (TIGR03118 family)